MFNKFYKYWPLLIPFSLTILSLVSWLFSIDVTGPFDARTGEPLDWLKLSMPVGTQSIEPLMSIFHLVFGAPNFRVALLSLGCWLFFAVFIVGVINGRGKQWPRRYLGSLVLALVSVWFLISYILFNMVHHIPGWTLENTDNASIIVDFQSHTEASHDGIVSIIKNLEWHKQVGFDVATISEHEHINTNLNDLAKDDLSALPAIIVGVEVGGVNRGYLLGLGLNSQTPISERTGSRPGEFIKVVHDKHQGAVISMTWGLDVDKVDNLVDSGIDAFEIANSGHPYIAESTRRKVLEVSKEQGLPLIGSTDWHGWTGFNRVWTVFKHSELPNVSRSNIGGYIVNELRNRNREAFIPVVAGITGGESLVREVFTPFYEWGRYGMELSPQRLLFWWMWTAIFILLFIKGKTLLSNSILFGLPMVLSAGIAFRGYELSQRAKLAPEGFFIRELPGQLYYSVAFTLVALFLVYILNRKKSQ